MTRPSAYTACQQLGRLICGTTSLHFVEAGSSTPGSVYAAALPPRAHRNSPAVSITPLPSPGSVADGPVSVQLLNLLCRAATARDALAVLSNIRELLAPCGEAWSDGLTRGVIGAPPASVLTGGAELDVWRLTGIEIATEPEPLSLGSGPSAAPSGEGEAQMRVALRGGAVRLADLGVVTVDGAPDLHTLALNGVSATLNTTIGGTTVIPLAGLTIAQLFTAIDAVTGFGATLDMTTRGAEPASAVLGFTQKNESDIQLGVRLRAAFSE